MIIISPESLSPVALRGVIEAFVLREGTEYGDRDYSLDTKCEAVLKQLHEGSARICFDPVSGTTDIQPVERSARMGGVSDEGPQR